MDPMRAIGIILVVSFLLDRIVEGLFFLLDFSPAWRQFLPDPNLIDDSEEKAHAARKRKVVYSLCVGFFGTVVIAWYLNIRVLGMTNMIPPDPKQDIFQPHALLDIILTGLIFVAGADRIAEALKLLGGPSADKQSAGPSAAQPIEITGKLVLEREGQTGQTSH